MTPSRLEADSASGTVNRAMFRSLRFRLPALFLAGILLSGLIAVLVSLQLFRSYAHSQALQQLRREAVGVAGLYEDQAKQTSTARRNKFAAKKLEDATGDNIYYVGTTGSSPASWTARPHAGDAARHEADPRRGDLLLHVRPARAPRALPRCRDAGATSAGARARSVRDRAPRRPRSAPAGCSSSSGSPWR